MHRVRQLLSILLALSLVAPFLGTGGWLHKEKCARRNEVKHQILAGMDKADLVLLKFSQKQVNTELRWEHAGEFEYQSQMYDIVESSLQGDSIYYWCWADQAETVINQRLDDLIEMALLSKTTNDRDQQQKQQKHVIDFFKSLYHDQQYGFLSLSHHHTSKPVIKSDLPYPGFWCAPPSPPPDLV